METAPRKRRRGAVALVALWLAAVGLSVAVGFGAVHLVGEEVADSTVAPLSAGAVDSQAAQPQAPASPSASPSASPAGTPAATPSPSGAAPRASRAPAPRSRSTRTVTVTGGTVAVRCTGSEARLLYATPADGYSSTVESRGPVEVEVEFRGSGGEGRVKARCSGGVATVEVRNR
jgi:hypothetical protein